MYIRLITAIVVLFATGCVRSPEAVAPQPVPSQPDWGIVIHTGAGSFTKESIESARPGYIASAESVMTTALQQGHDVLADGGSSLDAVEAAVRVMEDSPLFNAGKGAVFTHEGTNELDAAIADGLTQNVGAVAGLRRIKNPVTLARLVMEQSPHVMMIGDGAEAFARETGTIEFVDESYFRTERRWRSLQRVLEREKDPEASMRMDVEPLDPYDNKYGTVGAVALDQSGNLAAATSTGGMTNKRYGRVGDVPVFGAGTYASNKSCAVSATGHGEYFIRFTVARDICARVEFLGESLQAAADSVLHGMLTPVGGFGGVIAMDPLGNVVYSMNNTGLGRAYMGPSGEARIQWTHDETAPLASPIK